MNRNLSHTWINVTLLARRRARAPTIPCGPPHPSHVALEQKRETLMRRIERLQPEVKKNKGFKTAKTLLGPSYLRAKLVARVALLEAADFLITVLERLPS